MLWLPNQAAIMPPYTIVDTAIVRDADWRDPLPQIFESDGLPLNLTGKEIWIYVKPSYDYTGAIASYSNTGGDIVFDDAVNGLASMAVPRATVMAELPIGEWWHFAVLVETGPTYWELWRGPFDVHAGNLTTP